MAYDSYRGSASYDSYKNDDYHNNGSYRANRGGRGRGMLLLLLLLLYRGRGGGGGSGSHYRGSSYNHSEYRGTSLRRGGSGGYYNRHGSYDRYEGRSRSGSYRDDRDDRDREHNRQHDREHDRGHDRGHDREQEHGYDRDRKHVRERSEDRVRHDKPRGVGSGSGSVLGSGSGSGSEGTAFGKNEHTRDLLPLRLVHHSSRRSSHHYESGSLSHGGNYRDRGSSHRGGYRPRNVSHHLGEFYKSGGVVDKSSKHYKEFLHEPKLKEFSNPWINIMGITDEPTQKLLEERYAEMTKFDDKILELQKNKLKLELSMSSLEKLAAREKLHVQLTSEKLEEFIYL
ncbi:hypothetical protein LELG_03197 [Lodderomyces elongisporus NRRL YB-4239]|uniref:Transcription regulator LGE1 helical region domain-containing protein n=1 Tax=Lodderomyces elongisporus (strain ATCC 11503 / CBS 2605 / JCM 1781 / NBRC 1676 / NRRL YB-4239) TaxID=379508 RepID=A5E0R0_LODEL|nr:hypothetical protein LELG_03197 [Lodderomyces elongisporus NRRL YB-4239]